jgi:hypothetical protein
MQWCKLDHCGPTIVRLSDKLHEYCVLYDKKNGQKINLNPNQRYLLFLYYTQHYLKVDSIFQTNFWTSLLLLCLPVTSDHEVIIRCTTSKIRFLETDKSVVSVGTVHDGNVICENAGSIDAHPSIFVGRDAFHPKRGTCRWGVQTNQVVLNMTLSTANIDGAKRRGFSKFVNNKCVRWYASWKDPITLEKRYLTINSTDSMQKFDKARLLKRRLKRLHDKLSSDIESYEDTLRQKALAVYFIEHLCIRVGNEKDLSHEADTVGCCTLKAHTNIYVKNESKRMVCLTFVGKDSVPFKQCIVLPQPFFDQCNNMLKMKCPNTTMFSEGVSPASINRYIHSIAPGCSAKTFRTLKASTVFQRCIKKSNDLREANAKVARVLNHRKGPEKNKLNMETSRKNYIDPRVYIAHCKRNQISPRSGWSINVSLFQTTKPSFTF